MHHALSFSIVTEEVDADFEEDGRYVKAHVRALVDGASPFTSSSSEPVFDAHEVLIAGLRGGELDIYTCTCGVAGCAGIHWECHIDIQETTVSWSFPKAYYDARLLAGLGQERGDYRMVVFEREQYAAALAELTQQLDTLAEAHGPDFAVAPAGEASAISEGQTYTDFLEWCRVRIASHERSEAERRLMEGDLGRFALHTTLPTGETLAGSFLGLAYLSLPADVADKLVYLRDVAGPQVFQDPVGVLQKLDLDEWDTLFSAAEGSCDTHDETWAHKYHETLKFKVVETPT